MVWYGIKAVRQLLSADMKNHNMNKYMEQSLSILVYPDISHAINGMQTAQAELVPPSKAAEDMPTQ